MADYPDDVIDAAARALFNEVCSPLKWENAVSDHDRLRGVARAMLSAADAKLLEHGWKRVPREPTRHVRRRAGDAMSGREPSRAEVEAGARGTQGMQQIDTKLMTDDAEKLLRYIKEGPKP